MEAWREELYLSHHGIDGQKWGKRNGPPYPLDYSDHSSAEKKGNSKESLNNYSNHKPVSGSKNQNGNSGTGGGGSVDGVDQEVVKELANELIRAISERTGMKESEVAKLLTLFSSKGIKNAEYLDLRDSLAEGDPKQAAWIESCLKQYQETLQVYKKVPKSRQKLYKEIETMTGMQTKYIDQAYNLSGKAYHEELMSLAEGDAEQAKKIDQKIQQHKKEMEHSGMKSSHLAHHGINGQKWGKRNGPPYPLDYSDYSSAEKKENPKKEVKPLTRKMVKKMTDSELKEALDRKKKEQELIKLSSQDITDGKDFAERMLREFGTNAAQTFVRTLANKAAATGATAVVDALMGPLTKDIKKDVDKTVSKK